MNFAISESMPPIKGGCLFNNAEFHSLKGQHGYFYNGSKEGKTVARIAFYLNDRLAISGFRAPFGSLDCLPACTMEEQIELMGFCIDDFRNRGIETVIIKQPPVCYSFASASEEVLEQLGFIEESSERNQHLPVDDQPFRKKISQKERNKLNRAGAEGYSMKLLKANEIPLAYQLIQTAYSRKDFPVTMTEEDLFLAFRRLPERYLLFGLYDKNELIAVIASVRVSETTLYNFYHADLERYRTRSPLVMLIGKVYEYCSDQGVTLLDLGISSVDGNVNEGLFRFKENLGCLVSSKKTFSLNL